MGASIGPVHAGSPGCVDTREGRLPSGAMSDSRVVRSGSRKPHPWRPRGSMPGRRKSWRKPKNNTRRIAALQDFMKVLAAAPVTQTISQIDPAVERLMAEAEIYQHKGRSDLASDSWKRRFCRSTPKHPSGPKTQGSRGPKPPPPKPSPPPTVKKPNPFRKRFESLPRRGRPRSHQGLGNVAGVRSLQ
jgi:hypothetical protein